MRRLAFITVILVLAFAASAQARDLRSPMVKTPLGSCSIKTGGGIGCFGNAVPAPHGTDGYLWLGPRSKVRAYESGDVIYIGRYPRHLPRLRRGDRWIKRGVACQLRRGLVCRNRAGHAFRLWHRGLRVR